MSSFLDSTGLSRLASKITDYFAKKDGTYSNMTVDTAHNYDTSTGTIKTALDGKTDCVSPASAYGYTLLFTAGFNNTNARKGTISFRVHTSLNMQSPLILYGRIGANSAGYGTMYYTASASNEDRYKLCYKTVGDNTEVWLIDNFTGGSSERRTRVEFIEIQGSVTVGNNSSSTLPSGLIPFNPGYLKHLNINLANGPVGSASQPVYVDSTGSVAACRFESGYTSGQGTGQYWKLMTLTSYSGDRGWSGCVLDISWRSAGVTETGNGELRLSFGENNDSTIQGYAIASFTRGGAKPATGNVKFIVKSIGSNKYEIWCYVGAWSMAGARLRYGGISDVDYTMYSSSSDPSGTTIPWKLPSYT